MMEECIVWVKENYPLIISYFLTAVSVFMYIVNFVKMVKSSKVLKLLFKDKTAQVDAVDAAIRAEVGKLVEDTKAELEATRQAAQAALSEMEKQLIVQEQRHRSEMEKYRQSLIEISQTEKTLVSSGVSENIARRFNEEEHPNENAKQNI